MGERRRHAAQNENERERPGATLDRATVIQNVLGHRETESHHASVDYTVDDAVEFVAFPQKEDEQNEGLSALFDNWSRDHGAEVFSNLDALGYRGNNRSVYGIEDHRDEDCYQRAPEKRGCQHPQRF